MRWIGSIFATLLLAIRRLWSHRLLMACLLAGLVVAVGLLSAIPMYSDAINNRLLQGELTEQGTQLPPFAFVWRYIGAWNGDIDPETAAPIDEYLSEQGETVIGLPLEAQTRHWRTAKLRLFPDPDSAEFLPDEPLLFASVGFVTDINTHIQLTEGVAPAAAVADSGLVPVMISASLADQAGIQIGETYILFGQGVSGTQIPMTITGIWRPINAADPFWFYQPNAFDEVLLTSEAVFGNDIVTVLDNPITQAVWYQRFDGSRVRTNNVTGLLDGIGTAEARATALLDGTTLDTSPAAALATYGESGRLLTTLLTVFSIPLIGLVLYFISLVANMVVQRGQNEIAVLRSRGTTRFQITVIYLLEGLIIGALGLGGGLLLGQWLAGAMSRSRTFLDAVSLFDGTTGLPTILSPRAVQYGMIGVVLAILALLIPAFVASRFTIVTFKWERARSLRRPLWQRYFLDILLLIPPLYGWYLLREQGTIAVLNRGDDPFSNPLLFLVPALFCFALSLLFVRFFPLLMTILAWIGGRAGGVTTMLTLRQLARAASQYTGPLLLIILTLSLAVFTASMARTLDSHLIDEVYYTNGSDLSLAELGESTEDEEAPTLPGQTAEESTTDEDEPRFLFLPVSEHLLVDGVEDATRVGDYEATASIGGRQQAGRLLGIDRVDFPRVAFFRDDFATAESLGAMMNRLGAARDGILVSESYLDSANLTVGDPLRLTVETAGEFADVNFVVAGGIDLFPTYYPDEGPLFVANLDFVHEGLGGTFPYDVWLVTDDSADSDQLVSGVRNLGIAVVAAEDAREQIALEQTRPERQGVFGLLSVGFMAAATLTVLGFLVYAVVSFQRRFIQFGMLRAIGLSVTQMAGYLASEQALVITTGMALGTVTGVLASQLFIPFLQVGLGRSAQIPPFIVRIAWDQIGTIYIVFGAMFVVAVLVLLLLLVRMKVFEAIKLGETV